MTTTDSSVAHGLYTIEGAAAYLATTPRAVQTLVWSHRIRFRKVGRAVRFTKQDLDDFIEEVAVETRGY